MLLCAPAIQNPNRRNWLIGSVRWIGEATGLPIFNVHRDEVDPVSYDFLILATPVIYYKLLITDWVRENLSKLEGKPIVMVTVSGAPPISSPMRRMSRCADGKSRWS